MNLNAAIQALRDELDLIKRAIHSLENLVTTRTRREHVDYDLPRTNVRGPRAAGEEGEPVG